MEPAAARAAFRCADAYFPAAVRPAPQQSPGDSFRNPDLPHFAGLLQLGGPSENSKGYGTYTLTITGTSGSLSHNTTVTVTVN
jgi:hypothetical protein